MWWWWALVLCVRASHVYNENCTWTMFSDSRTCPTNSLVRAFNKTTQNVTDGQGGRYSINSFKCCSCDSCQSPMNDGGSGTSQMDLPNSTFWSVFNTNVSCLSGNFFGGLVFDNSQWRMNAWQKAVCARPPNLGGYLNNTVYSVSPSATFGSVNGTLECPAGSFVSGLFTLPQSPSNRVPADVMDFGLLCRFPPDMQCSSVNTPASYHSIVVYANVSGQPCKHQGCTVTQQCLPGYKPSTSGSTVMTCDVSGNFLGAYLNCTNMNECARTCLSNETSGIQECNDCSPNATCMNTDGSKQCTCKVGYTGNGMNCTNVNECARQCSVSNAQDTPELGQCNNCTSNQTCVDTPGWFTCPCSSGFTPSPPCTDVNECLVNCTGANQTQCNQCAAVATCSNTVGSYSCTCPSGYSSPNGGFTCADVNECTTPCGPGVVTNCHNCQGLQQCNNTIGGFTCVCPSGYQSVNNVCQNINECAANASMPANCSSQSTCVDTDGAYYCSPYVSFVSINNVALNSSAFFVPGGTQQSPADIVLIVIQGLVAPLGWDNVTNYGSDVNPTRYQATNCTRIYFGSSVNVTCRLVPGSGANLAFAFQFSYPSTTQPTLRVTNKTFSYPPPTLTSNTLRQKGNASTDLTVQTQFGQPPLVSMSGTNFPSAASDATVYVGPQSYVCAVEVISSTSLSCRLPADAVGVNMTFMLVTGTGTSLQTVNGTDRLTTVLVGPQILNLSAVGCTQLTATSIGNCPTAGNNLVTVFADQALLDPVLMLIAGESCGNPVLAPSNTSFTCTLPANTGVNLPTAFAHASPPRFSSILQLISYAPPSISQVRSATCTSISSLMIGNCPILGGDTLFISGQNFGTDSAVVRLGSVSLNAVHIAGSEQILLSVTLPSYASVGWVFSNDIVVVQSGGLSSNQAATLSFAPICSAGYYEINGVCTACTNGTYSVAAGRCSQDCLPCPRGMYQDSQGSSSCIVCGPGRYQDTAGASFCAPCSSGSYSVASGEAGCAMCPVGRFSGTARSACDVCGPGTFQPLANQSACLNCSAGQFSSIAEQVGCSDCPAGRISYAPASSQCASCVPGRFNLVTGSSACFPCAPGSFADQSGWAFACLQCNPGKFQDRNGSTTCNDCSVGNEQPLPNQAACTACNPGTYAATNGQSSCSLCDSGSYTDTPAATACIDCTPGRFENLKGASYCSDCSAGMWQLNYGSSSCLTCSPGFWNNLTAQTTCVPCNAGGFSSNEMASACSQCAVGSYQAAQGQTACQPCPVGRFGNDTGISVCLQCAPGYYSAVTQATTCTACVEGTYQPLQGQDGCSLCAEGEANPNRGAANCTACAAGSYQANVNSPLVCTPCPVGNYSQFLGATICGVCAVGKFTDHVGASVCTDCISGLVWDVKSGTCKSCPAGTSSDNLGQNCSVCAAGKYSLGGAPCSECLPGFVSGNSSSTCTACDPGSFARGGQSSCLPCPATQYTPFVNSSACLSCPFESIVDKTRAVCLCNPGYYSVMSASGQYTCAHCITGMRCVDQGVTVRGVQTLNGYWRINQTSQFIRCPRQQYCLGGSATANWCQPHRTGVLCGLCEVGYQANGASGVCELCPAQPTSYTYSILILLLMAFLLASMFYIVLRFSNMQHKVLREKINQIELEDRRNLEATLAKYNNQDVGAVENDYLEGEDAVDTAASFRDMSPAEQKRVLRVKQGEMAQASGISMDGDMLSDRMLAAQKNSMRELPTHENSINSKEVMRTRTSPNFMYKVKILVGFFQVATILPFQGGIRWPTAFADFISIFAFLNFDFMPWQSIGCVASITYFDKAIIVGCTPLLVLALLLLFFYAPMWIHNTTDSMQEQLVKQQRKEHLNRQFVKLTLFTVFLLYPFVSKTVLGIFNCIEVDGTSYLLADLSLLCFTSNWQHYAGVCGLFVAMYPIGIPLVYFLLLRRADLRDPSTTFMLGFLYEAYVTECYYWEIVDMLHKLLLTGIVAFAPANVQLVVNMPILICYLVVLLWTQPYVRKGDDRFHLLVQIELYLLALVGWILTPPNAAELTTETDLLISLLLIGLTAFLMSSFIIIAGRNVHKLVKQKMRSREQKLVASFSVNDESSVAVSADSGKLSSSEGS